MRRVTIIFAAASLLAGCNGAKEDSSPADHASTEAPRPSLHLLMAGKIDPAADGLWNAIGEGFEDGKAVIHAPKTPADWDALAGQVDALRQAFAQMGAAGLKVVDAGEVIQDQGTPEAPQPQDVQKHIDADPSGFDSKTKALLGVLDIYDAAIKARDLKRFERLSTELDEACESCHAKYWFPGQKPIS